MDRRKIQALTILLNAYQQTESLDYDLFLRGADWALEPYPPEAVERAVQRFLRGEVKRKSRAFAPSVEEITAETRQAAEYMALERQKAEQMQAKPALPPKKAIKPLTAAQLEARLKAIKEPALQASMRRLFGHYGEQK